jgi:hypothetical protein
MSTIKTAKLFAWDVVSGQFQRLLEVGAIGLFGGAVVFGVQANTENNDPLDAADPRIKHLKQLAQWDASVPHQLTELLAIVDKHRRTKHLALVVTKLAATIDALGSLYEASVIDPEKYAYVDLYAHRLKSEGERCIALISLEFGSSSEDDDMVMVTNQEIFGLINEISEAVLANINISQLESPDSS